MQKTYTKGGDVMQTICKKLHKNRKIFAFSDTYIQIKE